jgi:hypothetical protein
MLKPVCRHVSDLGMGDSLGSVHAAVAIHIFIQLGNGCLFLVWYGCSLVARRSNAAGAIVKCPVMGTWPAIESPPFFLRRTEAAIG